MGFIEAHEFLRDPVDGKLINNTIHNVNILDWLISVVEGSIFDQLTDHFGEIGTQIMSRGRQNQLLDKGPSLRQFCLRNLGTLVLIRPIIKAGKVASYQYRFRDCKQPFVVYRHKFTIREHTLYICVRVHDNSRQMLPRRRPSIFAYKVLLSRRFQMIFHPGWL